MVFNQLYITNKTELAPERSIFKSGHTMWIAELIKEDWLISATYSKKFGLNNLLKSFITKVLEYQASFNRKICELFVFDKSLLV